MRKLLYLFKQYRLMGVVGLIGITISIMGMLTVENWELAKDRERFQQQSTVLVNELQRQLNSYTQLTISVGTFLNKSEEVTQQEFQEFTSSLLPYYDGLSGLGWSKKVENQERSLYEQQLQSQGLIDFRLANITPEEIKSWQAIAQSTFPQPISSPWIDGKTILVGMLLQTSNIY